MPGTGPVGVGVIGTGVISEVYLNNLTSFPDVRVLAVGDLDTELAARRAAAHGVPVSGGAEAVLEHPEVEIVVNLTIPAAHIAISSAAIAAGKHVWSEKPLGINRSEARQLLDAADAAGLRIGVAPDTMLGPGIQTARRAIARGDIGVPISANTVLQSIGPDTWHPGPEFLFAKGAGPLFDMGPYYLSALVNSLGPIARVGAVGIQGRKTRTIQAGPRAGTVFEVEVPTLVQAVMAFRDGGIGQSVFSFDSHLARSGVVEISGTEGTLVIPDPNRFTGDVRIVRAGAAGAEDTWETLPPVGVAAERGLGTLDMARSIRAGVGHIATGELGYHVLDTMVSIDESITTGAFVDLASTVADIPLVPDGWDPFAATL